MNKTTTTSPIESGTVQPLFSITSNNNHQTPQTRTSTARPLSDSTRHHCPPTMRKKRINQSLSRAERRMRTLTTLPPQPSSPPVPSPPTPGLSPTTSPRLGRLLSRQRRHMPHLPLFVGRGRSTAWPCITPSLVSSSEEGQRQTTTTVNNQRHRLTHLGTHTFLHPSTDVVATLPPLADSPPASKTPRVKGNGLGDEQVEGVGLDYQRKSGRGG